MKPDAQRWTNTPAGTAGFNACDQGRAIALAGGDSREVGGNHVCTSGPPTSPDGGGSTPACSVEEPNCAQNRDSCQYTAMGCEWWMWMRRGISPA